MFFFLFTPVFLKFNLLRVVKVTPISMESSISCRQSPRFTAFFNVLLDM
jgi:hypothetical protein